jgi:hypothetical protein
VSRNRIVFRKRTAILIATVTLLGLVGTSFSPLHEPEYTGFQNVEIVVPYGFPFPWHGYSFEVGEQHALGPIPVTYWFSLESLLLDATFWLGISFFLCFAAMKISENTSQALSIQKHLLSRNLSKVQNRKTLKSKGQTGLKNVGLNA